MSVCEDIIMTVRQLRTVPRVDMERLSYSLTDVEWLEFAKELNAVSYIPKAHYDLWEKRPVLFYGITVRLKDSGDKAANHFPLRIEVQGR